MYSELKLNTPELQELARRKLAQAVKDHPNLSVQGRWNKVKEENPKLFGELQARDWEEDDKAEERERKETHGSFKPSNQATHQASIQCMAWEQADGSLVIQGAFANPL